MKNLLEMVKTLFLILAITQVMALLLRRTLVGKMIILCFRIIRELLKWNCIVLESLYKFLVKKTSKHKNSPSKHKGTVDEKKVVNFSDFKPREGA